MFVFFMRKNWSVCVSVCVCLLSIYVRFGAKTKWCQNKPMRAQEERQKKTLKTGGSDALHWNIWSLIRGGKKVSADWPMFFSLGFMRFTWKQMTAKIKWFLFEFHTQNNCVQTFGNESNIQKNFIHTGKNAALYTLKVFFVNINVCWNSSIII